MTKFIFLLHASICIGHLLTVLGCSSQSSGDNTAPFFVCRDSVQCQPSDVEGDESDFVSETTELATELKMTKFIFLLHASICIGHLLTALGCSSQSSGDNTAPFFVCRDLVPCQPSDGESDEYFAEYTTDHAKQQNLSPFQYLKKNCCELGGGEILTEEDPILKRLVCEEQVSPISAFQLQRSPAQNALYWMVKEDTYEISADSLTLVQRYALAVLFYQFGGSDTPSHWKSCHSESDSDDCHFLGGKAWLSPISECKWAFVECDRNDIVTGIFMPSIIYNSNVADSFDVSIAPEIGLLQRVTSINLRHNYISGSIPSEIGKLRYLRSLNLYGNKVYGAIPEEIYDITGLEEIVIARNSLSGTISKSINKLHHLRYLYLGYNEISGTIPSELGALKNLDVVNLIGTQLSGIIPSNLCKLYEDKDDLHVQVDCGLCNSMNVCCLPCHEGEQFSACDAQEESMEWLVSLESIGSLIASDIHGEALSKYIGCDWLEMHDDPGCPKYRPGFNLFGYEEDLADACCYCQCHDFTNWVNEWGDNCAWYERFDSAGCPLSGSDQNELNITANEACCWCGGSAFRQELLPSTSPSLSAQPSFSCYGDYIDWQDNYGFGCGWYEEVEEPGCPEYGFEVNSDGISAQEACCYCGGGWHETPSNSPTISYPSFSCVGNFIDWLNDYGDDCRWYEENDEPGCPEYGFEVNSDGISAQEACCYCGGGWDETPTPSNSPTISSHPSQICIDFVDWQDHIDNDCGVYEQHFEPGCTKLNDDSFDDDYVFDDDDNDDNDNGNNDYYYSYGISAQIACCYCGGGSEDGLWDWSLSPTVSLSSQPSSSPTLSSQPSQSSKPTSLCTDYIDWQNDYGDGCGWYKQNDEPGCPEYGDEVFLDGTSAQTVCCYCGGGSEDGQWDSPSSQPSSSPTVSSQPSQSSKPTSSCTDFPDWVGFRMEDWGKEYTCKHFSLDMDSNQGLTCIEHGERVFNGTVFAIPPQPSSSPTISSKPSQSSKPTSSCTDFPDWVGFLFEGWGEEYTCEDFNLDTEVNCPEYGERVFNGTVFAIHACCVCGGGIKIGGDDSTQFPNGTVSLITSSECTDLQIPRPWPFDCKWFEDDKAFCDVVHDVDGVSVTANEYCCSCGGGTGIGDDICYDFPGWVDSHPTHRYGCDDYRQTDECFIYGDRYYNDAHSAKTACCICGGGYSRAKNKITTERSKIDCFDEFNWTDTSGQIACDSFYSFDLAESAQKCLTIGHFTSLAGTKASEACCYCQSGHNDTGGGYRGVLRDKILRVGATSYADISFVHNIDLQYLEISGAIVKFLELVAENHGFGIIQYSNIEELNTTGQLSSDTYDACLNALEYNLLDICVGPYKAESLPPSLKSSTALYKEEYVLVVGKTEPSFMDTLTLPFRPFESKTWVLIMAVTFTLAALLIVIKGSESGHPGNDVDGVEDENTLSVKGILCRATSTVINSIYHAIRGFTSGSLDESKIEHFSISLKLVLTGFVLFVFFVVVAYSGSSAASFVADTGGPRYASLQDLIRADNAGICVHNSLYYPLQAVGVPDSMIKNTNRTDSERLQDLTEQDGGCDAVLISNLSLKYNAKRGSKVCDLLPLDDTILVLSVVIPISGSPGVLADELIRETDGMIERGVFQSLANDEDRSDDEHLCVFSSSADESSDAVPPQGFLLPALVSLLLGLIAASIACWKRIMSPDDNDEEKLPLPVGSRSIVQVDDDDVEGMNDEDAECNAALTDNSDESKDHSTPADDVEGMNDEDAECNVALTDNSYVSKDQIKDDSTPAATTEAASVMLPRVASQDDPESKKNCRNFLDSFTFFQLFKALQMSVDSVTLHEAADFIDKGAKPKQSLIDYVCMYPELRDRAIDYLKNNPHQGNHSVYSP
eukprot:CAMPEP_0196826896 /NCGR_PEP_ID=MMETSP1362-20130617/93853_1 /TAXON_ID=163516 /ORGANISM="Leptocylindrus danicus, Strain CCMP1856" /LENGTH=1879 /DNA_ID=CAMNT_0042207495 /DNA_START=399 /DNA_END=6037 /DNA_ORIENTATION=-